MKKLLSTLLALCMVLALLPGTARAAETSGPCGGTESGMPPPTDDVTWSYSNGTLTFQGTGRMFDFTMWATPWHDYIKDIHTVIIGNGITHIGVGTCEGTNAASITIPNGVTSIGYGAFASSKSLTSITIPSSVTFIDWLAFSGCDSLTDVYYSGSESQWKQISIDTTQNGNDPLLNATIHYNSAGSTQAPKVVLSPQKLTVDGKNVDCEKYNIDGANYFKLRDLAYLLNDTGSQFAVGYDQASSTVTITGGTAYTAVGGELTAGVDNSSTAQISRQTIQINGAVRNDLTVYNIGGSNFFQLRELESALDFIFEVGYDAATNTVLVTTVL